MAIFQPEGRIELISDVDIDLSYTHQYYFENVTAQNNFFASKVTHTLENGTYQRKNLGTIQIGYQADTIANVKYLRWQNPQYSNKWYYAFVLGIDYVNPGVSNIRYELDVYQTYLFNVEWKQSFIERQHTRRWLDLTVNNRRMPVMNTELEGLDYGSVYDTIKEIKFEQVPGVGWLVCGVTRGFGAGVAGGMATGIKYIFVPVTLNQRKNNDYYWGSSDNYPLASAYEVLNAFATNTSLVNSLVSAVIYPFLPLAGFTYTKTTSSATKDVYHFNSSSLINTETLVSGGSSYVCRPLSGVSASFDFFSRIDLTTSEKLYDNFPNYEESKLLMYPYSFMELTTKRGDAMPIKMEYIAHTNNSAADYDIKIGVFGTLSFVNKVTYVIKDYMAKVTGNYYYLEHGLNDASNNNVPIIDDYTASYLQSNSNSIRVAESNAKFSEQTALANMGDTYSTAMHSAMNTAISGGIQGLGNMASGGLQAVLNPLEAGRGAGQMIAGVADMASAMLGYDTAREVAQTNKMNTMRSVITDYANSVASILAKKQDAQQIPPSARSLGGDYMFNYANDTYAVYLLKKTITREYADKLTSYFKQYGYKVNKLEVPAFHTRTSWNYIKMTEPNVYGNIPMDDLMKIRDIFMKGITLWHGDYIGDYSRTNNER